MALSILEYLTQPNPILDCTKCGKGANTFNSNWDPVRGVQDWTEFNCITLLECYGDILQYPLPPLPSTSPPLSELERQIFNEDTFDHMLSRSIIPTVRTALHVAWPLCYPGDNDAVDIGRGGCAKRIMVDDSRLYPDWAGVQKSQVTSLGYKNLCPGESKLATKWSTSKEGQMEDDFFLPLSQLQTYCGRQWNARHGYIITPDELVVVQVSKELVGPGLAASRAVRNVPQYARDKPSHTRDFSIETISSGVDAMSIDKGSSYHDDDNPDIEYGTLLYKSIPWDAAGTGTLTVMLALWWIHMEAESNVSVQSRYTPLKTRKMKVRKDNESQYNPLKGQQATPDSPLNTSSTSTSDKGKGLGKKRR